MVIDPSEYPMPDRHVHRNPRASALVSIASLVAVVGLSSSLIVSTVWGAPPAADEAPPDDGVPQGAVDDPTPEAGGLGVDPTADAVISEESATPSDDELSSAGPNEEAATVPGASSLRAQMESSMGTLGELASEARTDEDLVRATCVLDKQDRANDVMDLGTSELLVIRDPGTSEQARNFALEKLDAAALRVDKLVEEAKACAGRQGPEDEVDITRNEADEPRTIPVWAPSSGLGSNPVPPPTDGAWPPTASPIE